jgi:hypothetical protein
MNKSTSNNKTSSPSTPMSATKEKKTQPACIDWEPLMLRNSQERKEYNAELRAHIMIIKEKFPNPAEQYDAIMKATTESARLISPLQPTTPSDFFAAALPLYRKISPDKNIAQTEWTQTGSETATKEFWRLHKTQKKVQHAAVDDWISERAINANSKHSTLNKWQNTNDLKLAPLDITSQQLMCDSKITPFQTLS